VVSARIQHAPSEMDDAFWPILARHPTRSADPQNGAKWGREGTAAGLLRAGTPEVHYLAELPIYPPTDVPPDAGSAARGRAPRGLRGPTWPESRAGPYRGRHGGPAGRKGPCVAMPTSRSRHVVTRSASPICNDAHYGRGSAHRRDPRLIAAAFSAWYARDVARTERDRRLEERAPKIIPSLRQTPDPGTPWVLELMLDHETPSGPLAEISATITRFTDVDDDTYPAGDMYPGRRPPEQNGSPRARDSTPCTPRGGQRLTGRHCHYDQGGRRAGGWNSGRLPVARSGSISRPHAEPMTAPGGRWRFRSMCRTTRRRPSGRTPLRKRD
jgi:hypothetical protein